MRTTFSGIHLFSDNIFGARHSFIVNRKGWAESLTVERQRARERQHCGKWVMVWAINLTIGQIFMAARERIIQNLIKMNIKISSKNLDVYFSSLGTLTFHPSNKLSICHKSNATNVAYVNNMV